MYRPASPPTTRLLPILVILLFLGTTLHQPIYGEGQPEEAQQAIEAAQSAINDAFVHVLHADLAGAPVADLVEELNQAIADLSRARAALNASNYQNAILYAQKAQDAAEAVGEEAQSRTTAAQLSLMGQLILAAVVAAVAVAAVYLILNRWRDYRRRQTRELLRMEIRLPDQQEEEDESEPQDQ